MPEELSTTKLDSLEPSSASVGDGEFILSLHGLGFTMHSQVFYDGVGKATGMLGPDRLSAPLNPGEWMGEPAEVLVSVKTGDHETPPLIFKLLKETENGQGAVAAEGRKAEEPSGSEPDD